MMREILVKDIVYLTRILIWVYLPCNSNGKNIVRSQEKCRYLERNSHFNCRIMELGGLGCRRANNILRESNSFPVGWPAKYQCASRS